jgi:hypothetical protein
VPVSLIADKISGRCCVNLAMEVQTAIPSQAGQICRLVNPREDENPDDVFIVTEDPQPFEAEDEIDVVKLKDLQRNLHKPEFAPRLSFPKNELMVIAADLAGYIQSWNTAV